MALLIDASVLVRLAVTTDAAHPVAARAVLELHRRGEQLLMTPQAIAEFWVVATRPTAVNGIGLSAAEAETHVAAFEASFTMFPEPAATYPLWRQLVTGLGVLGKQAHDARLVAVCRGHGSAGILTFNVRHFARLAAFWPGIPVVDPAAV